MHRKLFLRLFSTTTIGVKQEHHGSWRVVRPWRSRRDEHVSAVMPERSYSPRRLPKTFEPFRRAKQLISRSTMIGAHLLAKGARHDTRTTPTACIPMKIKSCSWLSLSRSTPTHAVKYDCTRRRDETRVKVQHDTAATRTSLCGTRKGSMMSSANAAANADATKNTFKQESIVHHAGWLIRWSLCSLRLI